MLRLGLRSRGVALLALLLAATYAIPAAAQSGTPDIDQNRERLAKIRRERTRLSEQLEQLRSQVHDASSELHNIEQQVSTSAALLNEFGTQISDVEGDVEQSTRELIATQGQLEHRRTTLHRRLRDIYKRGSLQTPQVLLTADSFSDLLNRYKYLYLVARRDRALVAEVAELQQQLTMRDRKLRRSLLELQTLRTQRSDEHAQIATLEAERRRALTGFQKREKAASQRFTKLAADEKRVRNLIATLERKRKEAERKAAERRKKEAARLAATRKAAGAPASKAAPAAPRAEGLSTRDIGALGWPVEGKLVYQFGRSMQPNGTAIRMNGIGIAAPVGSPVRSVDAGTVVLAGPFEGYGPTVVLSHGEGYYSLYLYLSRVAVEEGAEIRRGEVLGAVGGSGTPEGSHIEFQIRAPGGQAVDPLSWLRKRAG